MISVSDVQSVYNKLRSRKWKVVNEDYAQIKVSEYGMQLFARDGSVLSAGLSAAEQLHVWVTDQTGRAVLRILADESVAATTDFHYGYGSAVDLCEALLFAQHNVVWDDVECYLWDRAPLGGRELVVEFVRVG